MPMPDTHHHSATSTNPFLAGLPAAAPQVASMGPPPPPPTPPWPASTIGRFCFALVCIWLVITSVRTALRVWRYIRATKRRRALAEGAYVVMIPSINKE